MVVVIVTNQRESGSEWWSWGKRMIMFFKVHHMLEDYQYAIRWQSASSTKLSKVH